MSHGGIEGTSGGRKPTDTLAMSWNGFKRMLLYGSVPIHSAHKTTPKLNTSTLSSYLRDTGDTGERHDNRRHGGRHTGERHVAVEKTTRVEAKPQRQ